MACTFFRRAEAFELKTWFVVVPFLALSPVPRLCPGVFFEFWWLILRFAPWAAFLLILRFALRAFAPAKREVRTLCI